MCRECNSCSVARNVNMLSKDTAHNTIYKVFIVVIVKVCYENQSNIEKVLTHTRPTLTTLAELKLWMGFFTFMRIDRWFYLFFGKILILLAATLQ